MDRTRQEHRRYSVLSTQYSASSTPHSPHRTPHCVLRTRNSVLDTRYFALLLALFALSGCTTTSLFSKFTHKHKFPKATAEIPAVRCLCLWEPSEGTGVDNKPSRGLSGQIFFFTRGDASSVEVDGDVRIFVFDDEGSAEAQAQPLHQFDFLAGTWKAHLTSTQFGPAYQLFVPYSRKGRHQAELAVRVRLTPPVGSHLYSEIAKVTLPGYERAKAKEDAGVYEPEASHTKTATDNNFTSSDRITPEVVGKSLLEVLAERRSSAPGNELAAAETPTAIGSQRRARQGVVPPNRESGGELSVSDETNFARQSSSKRPSQRGEITADGEDQDPNNEE